MFSIYDAYAELVFFVLGAGIARMSVQRQHHNLMQKERRHRSESLYIMRKRRELKFALIDNMWRAYSERPATIIIIKVTTTHVHKSPCILIALITFCHRTISLKSRSCYAAATLHEVYSS